MFGTCYIVGMRKCFSLRNLKFCGIYVIMTLAMLINLQQSWSDKFMERIQNVIKRSQKMSIETKEEVIEDEPKGPKRRRTDEKLACYPITENNDITEDKSTIDKFKNAIGTELARSKPRDAILLPLMKLTYAERRMYILGEPISIFNALQQYPALKRPAIVSICMYVYKCFT